MPATDFGSLSAAQKILWSARIWQAGRDSAFFPSNGFMSTGMNSPIQLINELTTTARGASAIMQLVTDLQNDGVVGDNRLEGQEEALFNDAQTINIDQMRHGVRNKGRLSEQKTVIRFRATAKDKLGFWMADKLDELMFLTLAGMAYTLKLDNSTRGTSQLPSLAFASDIVAPSSGRKAYAGTATSTASLTSADTLGWNLCVTLQAVAKRKRLKPIKSGGRDHYVLLTSTEGMKDLRKESTYQTNVGRAAPRGSNNPLFNNAVAVIDGIIIYEHNKVPTTLGLASSSKWGSGGTVDGSQSFLIGAQALGFAEVEAPEYTESDQTDHGNSPALGIRRMLGLLKPQFASLTDLDGSGLPTAQDFGVISLYHAQT